MSQNKETVKHGQTIYIRYTDPRNRIYLFPQGKNIQELNWVFREHFDQTRQRPYFACLATKKTSWTLPDWPEQAEILAKKKSLKEEKLKKRSSTTSSDKQASSSEKKSNLDKVDGQIVLETKKSSPLVQKTISKGNSKSSSEDSSNTKSPKSPRGTPTNFMKHSVSSPDTQLGAESTSGSPNPHTSSQSSEESSPLKEHSRSRRSVTLSHSLFPTKRNNVERSNSFTLGTQKHESAEQQVDQEKHSDEIDWTTPVFPNWLQSRTELEESIQAEVFTKIGMGRAHVFYALKVNHFMTQNAKVIRKEKIFTIVRDFVGAYGVFLVEVGTSAKSSLRKKTMAAVDSFSMMQQFKWKELETMKGINRLEIHFIEDVLSIAIATQSKDKLKEALIFSFQQNMHLVHVDRALMKLATWDFLKSYHPTISDRSRSMKSIVESIITSHKSINTSNLQDDNFRLFKQRIRIPEDREEAVALLVSYLAATEGKKSYHNALLLAQYVVNFPTSTRNVSQERKLGKIFKAYAKSPAYEKRYSLTYYYNEADATCKALHTWFGRGFMSEQDFNIFGTTAAIVIDAKTQRKSRNDVTTKIVEPGVYIALFIVHGDEVVQDSKESLPMWRLNHVNTDEFTNSNLYQVNFEWIHSLGRNPFSICKQFLNGYCNLASTSIFRKSFIETLVTISTEFNCEDGFIHDREISLQKDVIIIPITRILDKQGSLPTGYTWTNLHEFEHKIYQKYNEIDILMRLEKLDDSFYGPRWVKNAIQFAYTRSAPTLTSGFYVAYLKIHLDSDSVLVLNYERNMIPYELVSKSSPTSREWTDIRTFFSDRSRYLPPKFAVSADTSESICKTFEQKFTRAYLRLKRMAGSSLSESTWYHISPITLDERDHIKLCIFVEFTDNIEQTPEESRWYTWRSRKAFEIINNLTYNPSSFSMCRESMINSENNGRYYNYTVEATDEILSRRDIDRLSESMKFEYQWLCMQWPLLIINWKQDYSGDPSLGERIWNHMMMLRRLITFEAQKGSGSSWDSVLFNMERFEHSEITNQDRQNPVQVTKNPLFDEELQLKEDDVWADIEFESYTTEIDNPSIILKIDEYKKEPCAEDVCLELTTQCIELAIIEAINKADYEDVKSVLLETIDTVELMFDLVDAVTLDKAKNDMEVTLMTNRQIYKDNLLRKYNNVISGMEGEPEDITSKTIGMGETLQFTYDYVIRSMVNCFNSTISDGTSLLQVINSTQEGYEIFEEISKYDKAIERKNKFLKTLPPPPAIVAVLTNNFDEITESVLEEFSEDFYKPYKDPMEKLEYLHTFEKRLYGYTSHRQNTGRKNNDQFHESALHLGEISSIKQTPKTSEKRKIKQTPNASLAQSFDIEKTLFHISGSTPSFSLEQSQSQTPERRLHKKTRKVFSLRKSRIPIDKHSFVKNLQLQNEVQSFAVDVLEEKYKQMEEFEQLLHEERLQLFNGRK